MMLTTQSLASSRLYCGFCPDIGCQTKLVFPSYESSIECTSCGQRHEQKALREVQEIKDHSGVLHVLRSALVNKTTPKRGTEAVKVLGLSNYHCKLLSPILTRYGMDKKTGRASLLTDLNQGEIFDCSVLRDRCFLIDPEHIEVVGYGRDISGSVNYLADTFATIKVYNANEERLVPIHADGDGHCLVHAISRALVGRELFWHSLRTNLKNNFTANLETYKNIFSDFIDNSEWHGIIEECDPDFEPPVGELLGLRNIHIFGLANVLKRPIILLDSLCGMQSSGDYAATFLPALNEPSACRNKMGELNKPLCIAWSSNGHNHYIPLVGIKSRLPPRLPQCLVPKVWGLPQYLVKIYIEFDENGFCVMGGDKCLQDSYILRLTSAMEEVFLNKYGVHPSLVADVHHYIYKRNGVVGAKQNDVIDATQKAVQERRLYVCLLCDAICEQSLTPESLKRGGTLYCLMEQKFGKLRPDKLYQISTLGVTCSYNAESDELVLNDKDGLVEKCSWCPSSQIRLVNGDGSIRYKNGDRTKTRSRGNKCKCGFKHYWDGKEYDSIPELLTVILRWNYKNIQETVAWFQNESDPSQNSNVYTVASALVQKHFPGTFGSERLVQQVVDQILEQTKRSEDDENLHSTDIRDQSNVKEECPSKIIVSGFGTVHKEELNMSDAERSVRQRIRDNAQQQHRRRSSERMISSRHSMLDEVIKPIKSTSVEPKNLPSTAPNSPISKPHKEQLTNKMIKVVISDGRQLHLLLDGALTSEEFLQKLEEKLGIVPTHIKKIFYGFPPKELVLPPPPDLKDVTLPFISGDKVSVEIFQPLQVPIQQTTDGVSDSAGKDTTLVQKLQDLQNSNIDNLDTAISSLLLTATLANQSIWIHVQKHPQLFAAGGLFYLQMKRDIGLIDGKHCRLPMLAGKVFRYNAEHDRLELCLEPHGHFAVEPGIEEKVLNNQSNANSFSTMLTDDNSSVTHPVKESDMPGSSGVFVSKSQQILSSHIPFHGQGYSLRGTSDKRDSTTSDSQYDCLDSDEKKLCDMPKRAEEQMETETVVDGSSSGDQEVLKTVSLPEMVRKGPGYSVINPELTNLCNTQVDRFRFLASQLALVTDDDEKNSVDCSTTRDSPDT